MLSSMRYLLVGNYGVGNAGDEVLRSYFTRRYPEVSWSILSEEPMGSELSRFPAGLRSFFSFGWLKTLRALSASDGLVFGGGSLFTDAESRHACFIWLMHVFFCLILRKPYFLAFQGIGPFRSSFAAFSARIAVRFASYLSVRDTASVARIILWKKNTEVVQTFDPAISLLKDTCEVNRTKKLFIFIPRFSSAWNSKTIGKFVRILEGIRREGSELRLISMQPSDPKERRLTERLSHELQVPVTEALVMEEVIWQIQGASCVLTERYHGIIAAALACGIPFLALRLREGDKLDALASMCGAPSETLDSFDESSMKRDWSGLREKLVSLSAQYGKLVEQGEKTLKDALKRFAR